MKGPRHSRLKSPVRSSVYSSIFMSPQPAARKSLAQRDMLTVDCIKKCRTIDEFTKSAINCTVLDRCARIVFFQSYQPLFLKLLGEAIWKHQLEIWASVAHLCLNSSFTRLIRASLRNILTADCLIHSKQSSGFNEFSARFPHSRCSSTSLTAEYQVDTNWGLCDRTVHGLVTQSTYCSSINQQICNLLKHQQNISRILDSRFVDLHIHWQPIYVQTPGLSFQQDDQTCGSLQISSEVTNSLSWQMIHQSSGSRLLLLTALRIFTLIMH